MIYKYTEIIVGNVKRNVLVRLLGKCAAVFVYDVDALAVSYEAAEALAKTINVLAYAKAQLLSHEVPVIAVDKCKRSF